MSGRTRRDKTVCNGNYELRLAWNHAKKAATPVRNRRFFRHFLVQVPFYYQYGMVGVMPGLADS